MQDVIKNLTSLQMVNIGKHLKTQYSNSRTCVYFKERIGVPVS